MIHLPSAPLDQFPVVDILQIKCKKNANTKLKFETQKFSILTVNTVWIAIANPSLGNALGTAPCLIRLTRELPVRVALSGVALVPLVLVGIVQAVVVACDISHYYEPLSTPQSRTIANIDARNAVAIVAREQIAKAGTLLALAVICRLVGLVTAIVISVCMERAN